MTAADVRALIADSLRPLATPIDALVPDPNNARRGDVQAIRRSLNVFGQRKPIVARRTGTDADGRPTGVVIAGNHTLAAATDLGWSHVAVTFVDDDETTARAYALADNRTGELAGWDQDQLVATLRDLAGSFDEIEALGWSDADLAALIADDEPGDGDDATDAPPADPITRPGDVWQLGPHRLVCGDARDGEAHARLLGDARPSLLLCDPPYGMRLDTDFSTIKGSLRSIGRAQGTRGNRYAPVVGDDADFDPSAVLDLYSDVREQFWWGADYYAERLPDRTAGSWLVWDKRKPSQSEAVGSEFELCWSRARHKRRILRHDWFGFLSSESPDEARNRMHPTQKPVALYADILDRWGAPGGVVLDAYAGSGTTVIACDRAGMVARVIEIEPAYCDVIARRWQRHSGELPRREGGEPVDFGDE